MSRIKEVFAPKKIFVAGDKKEDWTKNVTLAERC